MNSFCLGQLSKSSRDSEIDRLEPLHTAKYHGRRRFAVVVLDLVFVHQLAFHRKRSFGDVGRADGSIWIRHDFGLVTHSDLRLVKPDSVHSSISGGASTEVTLAASTNGSEMMLQQNSPSSTMFLAVSGLSNLSGPTNLCLD